MEEQGTQQPTAASTLRENALRPHYRFGGKAADLAMQQETSRNFVPAFDNLTAWSSIGLAVGQGI